MLTRASILTGSKGTLKFPVSLYYVTTRGTFNTLLINIPLILFWATQALTAYTIIIKIIFYRSLPPGLYSGYYLWYYETGASINLK